MRSSSLATAGLKLTRGNWASKLTEASRTPAVERSARSTWLWQAAQVMPMTDRVSMICSVTAGAVVLYDLYTSVAGISFTNLMVRPKRGIQPSPRRSPARFRGRRLAPRRAPHRCELRQRARPQLFQAWVTRRTRAPQCSLSMRSVTSRMISPVSGGLRQWQPRTHARPDWA